MVLSFLTRLLAGRSAARAGSRRPLMAQHNAPSRDKGKRETRTRAERLRRARQSIAAFHGIKSRAPDYCFDAFSCARTASTLLENAIAGTGRDWRRRDHKKR
jgi:hypothetical protein